MNDKTTIYYTWITKDEVQTETDTIKTTINTKDYH